MHKNIEKKTPKTLYKFRDWSNEYNRRILVENEFYFSNNYSFNDPYDLQLPIRVSHKIPFFKDSIIEAMTQKIGRVPTDKEIRLAEKLHPQLLKKNPAIFELFIKEIEEGTKEIEDRLGVFCMSKRNDSSLMWGHYANSHKGFCIGFDTLKLKKFINEKFHNGRGDLHEVEYKSEVPIFDSYVDQSKIKDYSKSRFITKFQHWSYEDEYRIIIDKMANQAIKIPKNIYKEIIFGYKMSELHRKEIRIIADTLFKDLEFYESKKSSAKFEMVIVPIKN